MAAGRSQAAVVAALSAAQLATTNLLLAYGADPNAVAAVSGSTPLHLAARSGAAAVVELLLRAGATLEARNRHGSTPLAVAAAGGHPGACSALLRAGARPGARDAHGRTAGWYAAAAGSAMPPADADRLFGLAAAAPAAGADASNAKVGAAAAGGGGGVGGGWGGLDDATVWGGASAALELCEVDRRPSELAPQAFEAEYLLGSRPMLLERGADNMHDDLDIISSLTSANAVATVPNRMVSTVLLDTFTSC